MPGKPPEENEAEEKLLSSEKTTSKLISDLRLEESELRAVRAQLEKIILKRTEKLQKVRENLEQAVQETRKYAESIVETVREPLVVLGSDMKLLSANKSFYRTFETKPDECEERSFYEIGGGRWDIPQLRTLLESILPERTSFEDYLVQHHDPKTGLRWMLLNARQVIHEETGVARILLAIEDITARRQKEEEAHMAKGLSDKLNEINSLIHSSMNIDFIMELVVAKVSEAIEAESAVIYMKADEGWAGRYVYGMPQDWVGKRLTDEEIRYSIIATKEKRTVVVNDAFNDEMVDRAVVEPLGIRAILYVAIVVGDDFIANFSLHYHTPGKKFEEQHVDFVNKAASSITLALENAMTFEKRRQVENTLRKVKDRLSLALEAGGMGVWELDVVTGRIWRSLQHDQIFGYSSLLPEWGLQQFMDHVLPEDRPKVEKISEMLEKQNEWKLECRIRRSDGAVRWIWGQGRVRRDEEGKPLRVLGLIQDVTQHKEMEEVIKHQASHDSLTDLPNRKLFVDIMSVELAQARRNRRRLALLFLDIDRFKHINDTLGHAAGDRLLKEVSGRLRHSIRESDTVARIGGDEFNILLPDLTRSDEAGFLVRKILTLFQKPFVLNEIEIFTTTSIGISMYPDDGFSIDELMKKADTAMYHAKDAGRNTYRFYNGEMNVRLIRRMSVEGKLRQALDRGEMELFFQPRIAIDSGELVSAEALLRWRTEEELLPPSQFLDIAEESGVIIPLGEWVLRAACARAREWQGKGYPLGVTVNISNRQFQQPALIETVSRVLQESGVNPELLELEVTENTIMRDINMSTLHLRGLRDLGVSLSIDDFGIGSSSLHLIKKLAFDRIKVDRALIQDMFIDADDMSVVNAVIAMSHNMKMTVAAEGVETAEQLSALKENGCDEAQGNYISEPLPAVQLETFIRDRYL